MANAKKFYLKTAISVFVLVIFLFFNNPLYVKAGAAPPDNSVCPPGSPEVIVNSQQTGTEPPFKEWVHAGAPGYYRIEVDSDVDKPESFYDRQYGWTNWKDDPPNGAPPTQYIGRIHGADIDYISDPNNTGVVPQFSPDPNDGGNLRINNRTGTINGGTHFDPPYPSSSPYAHAAYLARGDYITAYLQTGHRWVFQVHSVKDIPNAQGPWTIGDYRLNAGYVHLKVCPVGPPASLVNITINKVVNPGSDTGRFNLLFDNAVLGTGANVGNGALLTTGTVPKPAGVHTVSETGGTEVSGATTNLSNYTTTINCNGVITNSTSASVNLIETSPDTPVTCTITNTRLSPPALILNNFVVPSGGQFNLLVDGQIYGTNVGNGGSIGPITTLTAGTHNISVAAGTGTVLSDYNTTYGQDCNAAGAVTLVAGQTKTCTITNTKKTTLTVVKSLITHGRSSGDLVYFSPAIDGGPQSFGTPVQVTPGVSHTVSEFVSDQFVDSYYNRTVAGDCSTISNGTGSITLNQGDQKICVITNEEKPSQIIVTKTVINNSGGTAIASNFQLFVSGTPVTSGMPKTLNSGSYTVSESSGPNYNGTISGPDCDAQGNVTLVPGTTKSCAITNDDLAPPPNSAQLTVTKAVVNNDGGMLQAADFPLSVSGGGVNSTITSGTQIALSAGTYTVSETGSPNYAATISCNTTGFGAPVNSTSASITLAAGDVKTCTITNNDQPLPPNSAKLKIRKAVINDNGGTLQASDFVLLVNGGVVTSGMYNILSAGIYTISEIGNPNYSASITNANGYSGCPTTLGGSITLAAGDDKICIITNNDGPPPPNPAKLTVYKVVINNDGGNKSIFDFKLYVDGGGVVSGVQNTFSAGSHNVSETIDPNYTKTISGDCAANGSITLAAGNVRNCTITNDDNQPVNSIKVTKNASGGNGTFDFTSDIPGNPTFNITTAGGTGSKTFTNLAPGGPYSISETVPSGWANTGNDCNSLTVIAGQTASCSVTDVKNSGGNGSITVTKNASGGNGTFDFTSDIPGNPTFSITTVNGSYFETFTGLIPGTYKVLETLPNGSPWAKTVDTCGSITVVAGQTAYCSVTDVNNSLLPGTGSITVNKTTQGGDDTFSFTATGSGYSNFNITTTNGSGFNTKTGLAPGGPYSVSETVPSGWANTGNDCNSLTVIAGQTASCSVVNNSTAPPIPSSLNTNSQNYCILSPTGIVVFNWNYSSPGSYNEKKFQFQISANPSFSGTPIINRTFSGLNNIPPTSHNQSVSVASSEVQDVSIAYNRTYYWRVKEQDNSTGICSDSDPSWNNTSGSCSGWVQGTSFNTPVYPGPIASFIFEPPSPVNVGTNVSFTDKSTCYSGACTSWLWNFEYGGPTSSSQNPNYTYNVPGIHNPTLQVQDGTITCSSGATSSIKVGTAAGNPGSPFWREVTPLQ